MELRIDIVNFTQNPWDGLQATLLSPNIYTTSLR